MATIGNAASVTTATCTSHDPVKPTVITINAQIRRLAVTDIYRNLPLEERIGALRDGELTNQGVSVGSTPLTVQPKRKHDMSDDIAKWSCKQLPNGINPIVVCERQDLLDEIERLRREVESLNFALDDIADFVNDPQVDERIKDARNG
jgi:hypothetical protein